jgi:DNA-binding FadR family transcriptional regulator
MLGLQTRIGQRLLPMPSRSSNKESRRASRERVLTELLQPVTARKAAEAIVDQLVDLIRSGELRQGDELPGERSIAESVEVSRPTVRLAISALVEAGVLVVEPGRAGGARIASIWIPDGLSGTLQELQADQTFELLEARRVIEPRAAQLAAMRASDQDFQEMHESIERQEANQHDRARALQAEVMFHRVMWRAARNQPLTDVLKVLFDRLEVVLDMALRTDGDRSTAVDIHEKTLAALRSGSPSAVADAMDEHMAYLEKIVEHEYGLKRIREVPGFLRGSAG